MYDSTDTCSKVTLAYPGMKSVVTGALSKTFAIGDLELAMSLLSKKY